MCVCVCVRVSVYIYFMVIFLHILYIVLAIVKMWMRVTKYCWYRPKSGCGYEWRRFTRVIKHDTLTSSSKHMFFLQRRIKFNEEKLTIDFVSLFKFFISVIASRLLINEKGYRLRCWAFFPFIHKKKHANRRWTKLPKFQEFISNYFPIKKNE